jgi:uncharacterized protein (TIGR02594 family)
MTIPTKYKWITQEPGPKMILEAMKLFGTLESPGTANNPKIIQWAREVGGKVEDVYLADSIPWCGLFMAVVAKRAGKQLPIDPLWALNWGTFGSFIEKPMLGDVLVFNRRTADGKKAGHVGLYVGESPTTYHVLGGNQTDKVCFIELKKDRLYMARRPKYNNQPANVRKIVIGSGGIISDNEA